MRRREFIAGLGAAACPVDIYLGVAQAQSYPVRSITLVVPLASGGAVDTAARITAEKLRERLQQPVVVENRPGAGSVIGTAFVAKAPRDGYTLLLMEPGAVLAKWLNKTVPFDVTSDFSPIAMVATSPLVLFAQPSFPANDVKELISYSKANPRKLSVGTPGFGTPHRRQKWAVTRTILLPSVILNPAFDHYTHANGPSVVSSSADEHHKREITKCLEK